MKKIAVLLVLSISLIFFLGCTQLTPDNNNQINDKNNSEPGLSVELFVMSQCPYGTQAEDAVIPVIKAFGDKVDFKLYFIAGESGSGFTSLHGQPEVNEDIRQACIQEKFSQDKFFDYLSCVNTNITDVENTWKSCAEKAGINTSEIESCSSGEEGKKLFSENIKVGNELGVGSSPTYFINNEVYSGGRSAQDITRTVCSFVEAEACNSLPKETEVNFFVVNDSSCNECNVDNIAVQLKSWFPKLKVTEIEFSSDKGKEVLDKFQAETVPFIYFDSTLTKHYNWDNFKLYTTENDGLYALNFTGNKFFKRTVKEKHIDLFVMSQCPYGTLAENNLKEVAEAVPDMTYSIYFIASETDSGFSSLHGQVEVNEDIRQSCVIKYYREKILDYTFCVNKDIANVEGNWKACAIENDLNVSKIESCFNSVEGKNLLKENIAETNQLRIGSSPTFIVNGQILFNVSSAEAIKQV
ncbi:MAG: thioredoxin domain-containing protein, partial [archaeon]